MKRTTIILSLSFVATLIIIILGVYLYPDDDIIAPTITGLCIVAYAILVLVTANYELSKEAKRYVKDTPVSWAEGVKQTKLPCSVAAECHCTTPYMVNSITYRCKTCGGIIK